MAEVSPWILAKSSLKYFTKKVMGLVWPNHYEEWRNKVDANQFALFQAPRGSWKSFFFSLAYPLWRVINSKTEILIVSDSETIARKLLWQIRQAVELKPFLEPLRPSTKELWGVDQISFANGSLISTMGFGSSRRGTHPDVIICDDIEGENNKMSREDKDRMFFGVIIGMALPHTKLITVGTPVEFRDILDQLENDPDKKQLYHSWKRPGEIGGVNQYADIWTDEWLRTRRLAMGSLNYAREIMLERIDPATQPFKREYEMIYTELPAVFARTVTVCDPAYTETDGDATAIVTVGFTHGNHAYVRDAREIRRDEPGRIVDELFKVIATYEPDVVGIEKKKGEAVSFSFEERMTREERWSDFQYVELSHGGKSKGTRANMAGGLVPRWEARTVHIHRNQTNLLDELYKFRLDGDQKGHDDLVDALAYCFHPDMARPNAGKMHKTLPKSRRETKAFISLGAMPAPKPTSSSPFGDLGKSLDRRIYDAA